MCLFFGDAALTMPELQRSLHAILTAAQQLEPPQPFAATYEDILRRGVPLLDINKASSVHTKSDSEDELSFEPSPWEPWKVVVCLREKRRYPMLQALDYAHVDSFNKELNSNLRRRLRNMNGSNSNDKEPKAEEGEASKKESGDIEYGHGMNDAAATTSINRSSPVDKANELPLSRVETNSSDFAFSFVNPTQGSPAKDVVVSDTTQQKSVSGSESTPAITSFDSDPAAAVIPPKSSFGKGQTKSALPHRRRTSNKTAEQHNFVGVNARGAVEGSGSLETRGHHVSESTEITPMAVSDDEVDLLKDTDTELPPHKDEEDLEGDVDVRETPALGNRLFPRARDAGTSAKTTRTHNDSANDAVSSNGSRRSSGVREYDDHHERPAKRLKSEHKQNWKARPGQQNDQIRGAVLPIELSHVEVRMSPDIVDIFDSEDRWLNSAAIMLVMGLFTSCCPWTRVADSLWIASSINNESARACFRAQGTEPTKVPNNDRHHSGHKGDIQILFPLNVADTHWLLAVTNADAQSFRYLDSIKCSPSTETNAVLSQARSLARTWGQQAADVQDKVDEPGGNIEDYANDDEPWLVSCAQQGPEDSFNCGIYTIVFGLRLLQSHCLPPGKTGEYTPESPIPCPLLWRRLFALIGRLTNDDIDTATTLLIPDQLAVNAALPAFQPPDPVKKRSSHQDIIASYIQAIQSNKKVAREKYASRQQSTTALLCTIREMQRLFAWAKTLASAESVRLKGGAGPNNAAAGGGVLAQTRNELQRVQEQKAAVINVQLTQVSNASILTGFDSTIKLLLGSLRFWNKRADNVATLIKLIGPVSEILARDLKRLEQVADEYTHLMQQVDEWDQLSNRSL